MRLLLAAVGRLKDGPERALVERYSQRIDAGARAVAIGPLKIIEMAEARGHDAATRKADEAQRLLKAAVGSDRRIVLNEVGSQLSSVELARHLARLRDDGCGCLAFCIGGPDGHGPDVAKGAQLVLSLGSMTLPHGLVRVVLVEQLYRAQTILAGHPYHRE
jgi:23S rRNA (pseudouridine1915-N3)-methyltransferase